MRSVLLVCDDLFGAEIYAVLQAINRADARRGASPSYAIKGYISDSSQPFGKVTLPLPRLGDIAGWQPDGEETCVLGIADPARKREAVSILLGKGAAFETVVAPWIRGPVGIEIGEGSILAAYSCANDVHLGKYVTVMGSMLSGHALGDYSTVLRFANVAGEVGEGVSIGNHVFIPIGKTVGDGAVIEDGSIVSMSVKPGSRIAGVPARKVKNP